MRLKVLGVGAAWQAAFTVFQFQTGAIKSSWALNVMPLVPGSFNSKLVRLKDVGGHQVLLACVAGFNSKLVRLKGGCSDGIELIGAWFQFQTGAIKR